MVSASESVDLVIIFSFLKYAVGQKKKRVRETEQAIHYNYQIAQEEK